MTKDEPIPQEESDVSEFDWLTPFKKWPDRVPWYRKWLARWRLLWRGSKSDG